MHNLRSRTMLNKKDIKTTYSNRNQNACAKFVVTDCKLFNLVLSVVNARYSENTDDPDVLSPYCKSHQNNTHSFQLQDTINTKNKPVDTVLTAKVRALDGTLSPMVVMTFYHTGTVIIQGIPNNVEVFIDDHVIPLFKLVGLFHAEMQTSNIESMTGLSINQDCLCLRCQEITPKMVVFPPTISHYTSASHPESTVQSESLQNFDDLSAYTESFFDKILNDPGVVFPNDKSDETSIPCGQGTPFRPQATPHILTPNSAQLPNTSQLMSSIIKSTSFIPHSRRMTLRSQQKHSTPIIAPHSNRRLDNLELEYEHLKLDNHNLTCEVTKLSKEVIRLSDEMSSLLNRLEQPNTTNTTSPPPSANSQKNKRRRNRRAAQLIDNSIPDPSHFTADSSPADHPRAIEVDPRADTSSSTPTSNHIISFPILGSQDIHLELSIDEAPSSIVNSSHLPPAIVPTYSEVVTPPDTPPLDTSSHALPTVSPVEEVELQQPTITIRGYSNLHGMRNMFLNALPNASVKATSGATLHSVQDDLVHSSYADILVLIVGTNDANQRDSVESCRDDIHLLVSTALQKAGTVILAPPPPNTKSTRIKQAVDKITNIMVEEAAQHEAVLVVPVATMFPSEESVKGYLFRDSLHMTKLGAGHYTKLVLNSLKTTYTELAIPKDICVRCHLSGHLDVNCRNNNRQQRHSMPQRPRAQSNSITPRPLMDRSFIHPAMQQWNQPPVSPWTCYPQYNPYQNRSQNWSNWKPQNTYNDLYGSYNRW